MTSRDDDVSLRECARASRTRIRNAGVRSVPPWSESHRLIGLRSRVIEINPSDWLTSSMVPSNWSKDDVT